MFLYIFRIVGSGTQPVTRTWRLDARKGFEERQDWFGGSGSMISRQGGWVSVMPGDVGMLHVSCMAMEYGERGSRGEAETRKGVSVMWQGTFNLKTDVTSGTNITSGRKIELYYFKLFNSNELELLKSVLMTRLEGNFGSKIILFPDSIPSWRFDKNLSQTRFKFCEAWRIAKVFQLACLA